MTILELLQAHDEAYWNRAGIKVCQCGYEYVAGYGSAFMLSHLSAVIENYTREREAAALEEAAAELAQESDAASHTARKLSGDDNTRYHAYSSAYSVAAYKLENRAAQLKGKP